MRLIMVKSQKNDSLTVLVVQQIEMKKHVLLMFSLKKMLGEIRNVTLYIKRKYKKSDTITS